MVTKTWTVNVKKLDHLFSLIFQEPLYHFLSALAIPSTDSLGAKRENTVLFCLTEPL